MQKHVNLVDLVKSFPTNIFLQNLASIQKRTSPIKFAHLAEKSENGSISNLSTKVRPDAREGGRRAAGEAEARAARVRDRQLGSTAHRSYREPRTGFTGLVLGSIEAKFCN